MAIVSFLEINVCGPQDTKAMSRQKREKTSHEEDHRHCARGERSTTVLRERVLKDIRVGRIRGGVVAGASVLPSPWTLSKSAEGESCLYLAKATQSLVFVLAPDRRPVGASPLALPGAASIDLSQCSPAVCGDDAVVSGC